MDAYDLLPYTDHAFAETHPDRLAVVARLSGWEPPELGAARILELGCGRGGNLLPMAASLPGASLLGIDRSSRQIDEAARIAREAGVRNVRFERAAIESYGGGERFDFVVCHGVCSWVPAETRRALLALVSGSLAPGGIAYVSFNVLPGWYERLAVRDWLRMFPEKDARASLGWLREAVSAELGGYRRRIDAVASRIGEAGEAYAAHEYLAEEQHPQHVSRFLAEASAAGLAYLGDAIPSQTAIELLPDAVAQRAASLDVAQVQQLVDFVRDTAFRRALLVRAEDASARGWRWPLRMQPRAISGMRVASRLVPHEAARAGAASERFDGPDGSVLVSDAATRRALHRLAEVAPRSLPCSQVAGGELFDLWLSTGGIDLHAREPTLGDERATRPEACPVARWHAVHGGTITNRWHQEVVLSDPVLRRVLALLDGTRGIDDVGASIGDVRVAHTGAAALARAALLVR
ncbi:MAG TPA: class I SAM-dependent methyltransferase [Polyangiaceae bacterium]